MNPLHSRKGFTLLELLIAMVIVSFFAVFTSNSISSVSKTKKKLQKVIDETTEMRNVLNLMQRDFAKAFNYRDIHIRLYNEAKKEQINRASPKQKADSNETNSNNSNSSNENEDENKDKKDDENKIKSKAEKLRENFKPKEEKIVTQFKGEKDKVSLSTLSYIRYKQNAKESTQAEVSYFLKSCNNRFNKDYQSNCLFRRISPTIDDEIDQGGEETMILENITKLEFKYIKNEVEEAKWLDTWDSEKEASNTYPVFPDAVEINLEVFNKNIKNSKKIAMTVYAPIHFSNNPDPELKPFSMADEAASEPQAVPSSTPPTNNN